MIEHKVKQGECVSSIAAEHGVPAKKVWNAADNEALREQRRTPDVLLPGDTVLADSLRGGWWRVALEGKVIGYVYGPTLSETPGEMP